MVIECTACRARFKLADEKVKPGGTKVRCSKCKEVFTVMPPPPPAAEEPPAAAEEEVDFGAFNMERMAETSPPEAPAPAEPPQAEIGSNAGAAEADRPALDEFEQAGAGENSWEGGAEKEFSFGGSQSTAGDRREEAFGEEQGEEALGGSEGDEFAFGEEQAQGEDEFAFDEEQEEEALGGGESGEFAFGEEQAQGEDEFAFGEEAGEEAFGGGESDEFAFGEEEPTADFFGLEESETAGPVEFAFEEETSAEGSAEFSWDEEESGDFGFDEGAGEPGEAEDFDFSGISFGEEESAPAPAPERPAVPEPQAARVETETFRPQRDFARPDTLPPAPAPPPVMPAARRRKSPLRGVMSLLLLLLLALLGGAVYLYWQGSVPELTKFVDRLTGQAAPPAASGQIRLEGLSSYYVANREAGQMLVIQGQAVNGYPEPRSSITVKGVVFNKAGKPVLQQTVYCGNPFTQETLKKLPFAKIEEGMNNPFGESLSNLNVAPSKAIPFTVVLHNLPADIAEFSVEVVDSKPGTKQ